MPSRKVLKISTLYVAVMCLIAGPVGGYAAWHYKHAPKTVVKTEARIQQLAYPLPSRDAVLRKTKQLGVESAFDGIYELKGKYHPALSTQEAESLAAIPPKMTEKKSMRRPARKAKRFRPYKAKPTTTAALAR